MKRFFLLNILFLIVLLFQMNNISAQEVQNIKSVNSQNVPKTQIPADKYFEVGEKFFNEKKYKDALKYYIAAIKIDKNYVLAWKKIGFCYYQLKNHDMAN
ncbi:MAG: tetratricopeptide repeat protein, partial [Candidatus Goldbacteria bacterium]|nr:tetratricopeptide repeat protein [Candidatus Goldiibacteriota bacterium]